MSSALAFSTFLIATTLTSLSFCTNREALPRFIQRRVEQPAVAQLDSQTAARVARRRRPRGLPCRKNPEGQMSGQHEVIGFLSRADSYGCPGGTVERIETHGSLIFLCGERV